MIRAFIGSTDFPNSEVTIPVFTILDKEQLSELFDDTSPDIAWTFSL
jgi:hypothetical protein